MVAWWDSLSLAAQIFACVAIPATLVLIVQTILMLIGADSEAADTDTPDFDDTALDTDVDATSDGDIFDGDIDVSGMDAL